MESSRTWLEHAENITCNLKNVKYSKIEVIMRVAFLFTHGVEVIHVGSRHPQQLLILPFVDHSRRATAENRGGEGEGGGGAAGPGLTFPRKTNAIPNEPKFSWDLHPLSIEEIDCS